MRQTRSTVLALTGLLSVLGLAVSPAMSATHAPSPRAKPGIGAPRARAHGGAAADFDGDGYGDLAVGVPGEDIGDISNAGGVNIFYGGPTGLTTHDNKFFSQASSGVVGSPTKNAAMGRTLAVGDFDHDGNTDLAIGLPFASVIGRDGAGGVEILYGSLLGLLGEDSQYWTQNSHGMRTASVPGAEFGDALSVGDYNHDGYKDLAIGAPHYPTKANDDAGSVTVMYGSPAGLTTLDHKTVFGPVEAGGFGTALASGAFDGNAGTDLAVGSPGEAVGSKSGAGEVRWWSGSAAGIAGTAHKVAVSDPTTKAHCGSTLAAGNIDGGANGTLDLVVGCPDGNHGTSNEGYIEVHNSTKAGGIGADTLYSVADFRRPGSQYAAALATGDVGAIQGKTEDEILIGQPLFSISDDNQFDGVAYVANDANTVLSQDVEEQGFGGVIGTQEAGDIFGSAVTAGDFNGDGWADAVFGVPGEGIGNVGGAGGINVLYGSPSGLTSSGSKFFSQATSGVDGVAEREDFFGNGLAARTD